MAFKATPLEIASQLEPGHTTMIVQGEIDMETAPQLRHALADCLSTDRPCIYLDLTGVSFIDSSGLHALLAAQRRARSLGGDLVVTKRSHQVDRLIAIAGVPFLAQSQPPTPPPSDLATPNPLPPIVDG